MSEYCFRSVVNVAAKDVILPPITIWASVAYAQPKIIFSLCVGRRFVFVIAVDNSKLRSPNCRIKLLSQRVGRKVCRWGCQDNLQKDDGVVRYSKSPERFNR